MNKFTDAELARMRYNVYGREKKDIVKAFPDMAIYEEVFYAKDLPDAIDPDDLFIYLALMFDPLSPSQNIPDPKKRKVWAMQMINQEPPYEQIWDSAIRWQIRAVNTRAIVFLMVAGSEKYAMWQYNLGKLLEIMSAEIKLEGEDEKATQAAMSAEKTKNDILKSLTSQISESKKEFLQGETSKELEQEALRFTLSDTLGIRPEEYIQAYEMMGTPFPKEEIK